MSGKTLSRGSHSRGQLHQARASVFYMFMGFGWIYLARVGLDLFCRGWAGFIRAGVGAGFTQYARIRWILNVGQNSFLGVVRC